MGYVSIERNVGGLAGLCLLKPRIYADERGWFMETFNPGELRGVGIEFNVMQENQSRSVKGTLRGLHFQIKHPQGKIVRAVKGEVYDVAVDIRPDSITFGKHYGAFLSADNRQQLLVPRGFAHGFLTLSDAAEICYMCDEGYHGDDEGGIAWNDIDLAIDWPHVYGDCLDDGTRLTVSEKDKKWPTLREMFGRQV